MSFSEVDFLWSNHLEQYPNRLINATGGYCTLLKPFDIVLAHYTWHKSDSFERSKGIINIDHAVSLENVNILPNRRIQRMFDVIDKVIAVIFIFDRLNYYDYMQVANKVYALDSLGTVEKKYQNSSRAKQTFGSGAGSEAD